MAFTIDKFRSGALAAGGARANLFEVVISGIDATLMTAGAVKEFTFACKAANIPPMAVGVVEVPYFGRVVKVPGNKTFDNWSVTIINDEGFAIRSGFEKWVSSMGTHIGNVQSSASSALESGLYGAAEVTHFGKTGSGSILATYNFVNIFPVSVGEIALGWDANDAVEEFTVEFAYDYWTHKDVVTT
ncbi:MAG TPA: hypothetical protein EYQ70_00640 [Marine Group III euryarchaeote]|jgi:hypothetical protein|uniref:Phage tail protein n=1 Tax=Marine Group III euryarchaeote TaxID=2173149 RepID=A0A7J4GQJ5_9ARCH|nr:hypothetical protein [Marine Group III euryarchaeote]